MSSELQKSVENLINVKSDQKRLDNFAKERYNEEYPIDYSKPSQGYHYYDSFKIIDENTIKVFFKYGAGGAGDYDYDGSFEVDMRPYYRDEKLEKL